MNTLTDLLLGVGQPRVSHFPDLCTLLYTYLSTLDYWTKIVYYLFTQTSPVAHTSALTPTYIKSHKLPNWPISKELGLGRMLLPHWKLLFSVGLCSIRNLCKFLVVCNIVTYLNLLYPAADHCHFLETNSALTYAMQQFIIWTLIKRPLKYMVIFPMWWSVAYFTKEVDPNLTKLPLKFNGGLVRFGLNSLVK